MKIIKFINEIHLMITRETKNLNLNEKFNINKNYTNNYLHRSID